MAPFPYVFIQLCYNKTNNHQENCRWTESVVREWHKKNLSFQNQGLEKQF